MGVDAVDGGVTPGQEVDGPDGQGEGVGSREAGIGGGAEIDRGDQAGLVLPAGQRGLAAQGGDGWAGLAVQVRCQGADDLIGDGQGPARHAVVCLVGQEDAVDGPAAPEGGVGFGLDGGDGVGGSALGEGRGEGEREGQEGGGQKGQGGGQSGHGVSPWDCGTRTAGVINGVRIPIPCGEGKGCTCSRHMRRGLLMGLQRFAMIRDIRLASDHHVRHGVSIRCPGRDVCRSGGCVR